MKILATFLATVGLVASHGYVDNATISGQYYQPARASRSIPGNGPVQDVTLIDLQCNSNSTLAKLHAAATAGSTVTLRWTLWPESHVGPVITYMARCPDTGCQDYSPRTATPLMTASTSYEYTIPSCLKPGFYLVRHEIIALHAAYTYPGAQFYPGCHQLNITSGGSTVVPAANLVAFPGAYKGSDPGITYDAYQATTYTIPDPALFTC